MLSRVEYYLQAIELRLHSMIHDEDRLFGHDDYDILNMYMLNIETFARHENDND